MTTPEPQAVESPETKQKEEKQMPMSEQSVCVQGPGPAGHGQRLNRRNSGIGVARHSGELRTECMQVTQDASLPDAVIGVRQVDAADCSFKVQEQRDPISHLPVAQVSRGTQLLAGRRRQRALEQLLLEVAQECLSARDAESERDEETAHADIWTVNRETDGLTCRLRSINLSAIAATPRGCLMVVERRQGHASPDFSSNRYIEMAPKASNKTTKVPKRLKDLDGPLSEQFINDLSNIRTVQNNSLVGFGKADITDGLLEYGTINPRSANEVVVQQIAEELVAAGIAPGEEHVVPILIDSPDDIEIAHPGKLWPVGVTTAEDAGLTEGVDYAHDFIRRPSGLAQRYPSNAVKNPLDHLPLARFKKVAFPGGGNHRQLALRLARAWLAELINDCIEIINSAQEGSKAKNKATKEQVAKAEARLAGWKMRQEELAAWPVVIYEKKYWNSTVQQVTLASNRKFSEQAETANEAAITLLKLMADAKRLNKTQDDLRDRMNYQFRNDARFRRTFNSPLLMKPTLALSLYPAYLHTKSLDFLWLNANCMVAQKPDVAIAGSGFYITALEQAVVMLDDLCCDVEWNSDPQHILQMATVRRLKQKKRRTDEDEERLAVTEAAVATFKQKIRRSNRTVNHYVITNDILDIIDDAYVKHIRPHFQKYWWTFADPQDEDYEAVKTSQKLYIEDIIGKLPDRMKSAPTGDPASMRSGERTYGFFAERLRFVCGGDHDDRPFLPLWCSSLQQDVAAAFDPLALAVTEIINELDNMFWDETVTAGSNDNSARDPSYAMIYFLKARNVTDDGVRQFMQFLLIHRSNLLVAIQSIVKPHSVAILKSFQKAARNERLKELPEVDRNIISEYIGHLAPVFEKAHSRTVMDALFDDLVDGVKNAVRTTPALAIAYQTAYRPTSKLAGKKLFTQLMEIALAFRFLRLGMHNILTSIIPGWFWPDCLPSVPFPTNLVDPAFKLPPRTRVVFSNDDRKYEDIQKAWLKLRHDLERCPLLWSVPDFTKRAKATGMNMALAGHTASWLKRVWVQSHTAAMLPFVPDCPEIGFQAGLSGTSKAADDDEPTQSDVDNQEYIPVTGPGLDSEDDSNAAVRDDRRKTLRQRKGKDTHDGGEKTRNRAATGKTDKGKGRALPEQDQTEGEDVEEDREAGPATGDDDDIQDVVMREPSPGAAGPSAAAQQLKRGRSSTNESRSSGKSPRHHRKKARNIDAQSSDDERESALPRRPVPKRAYGKHSKGQRASLEPFALSRRDHSQERPASDMLVVDLPRLRVGQTSAYAPLSNAAAGDSSDEDHTARPSSMQDMPMSRRPEDIVNTAVADDRAGLAIKKELVDDPSLLSGADRDWRIASHIISSQANPIDLTGDVADAATTASRRNLVEPSQDIVPETSQAQSPALASQLSEFPESSQLEPGAALSQISDVPNLSQARGGIRLSQDSFGGWSSQGFSTQESIQSSSRDFSGASSAASPAAQLDPRSPTLYKALLPPGQRSSSSRAATGGGSVATATASRVPPVAESWLASRPRSQAPKYDYFGLASATQASSSADELTAGEQQPRPPSSSPPPLPPHQEASPPSSQPSRAHAHRPAFNQQRPLQDLPEDEIPYFPPDEIEPEQQPTRHEAGQRHSSLPPATSVTPAPPERPATALRTRSASRQRSIAPQTAGHTLGQYARPSTRSATRATSAQPEAGSSKGKGRAR
ncbi:hypothetical protein GLOTRDRAFT_97093 [Gloeophyllum trabeum ATCC 11539]|uniref:Uncharacterized protein n=1 Tax=Gloeophyllum trabeum (strain ATCC 11539 / FP-39264 / Madison 617) TaxID=670483 RepID=S7RD70_GLOTA|nr:uncharacterized protein GLOTRDRAFT_97093 [Gloeophyllum trabeum ATCC 11539]EPQ50374.1 hypothetical protein GLOTRDRAFT_97093 [Gloeophyllum trabeum ATCC 11539]